MPKFLILGGHPKGHDIPFSPATLSGKRLRPIVAASPYQCMMMDLWENQEDEDSRSTISLTKARLLFQLEMSGWALLAAGRVVYEWLHRRAYACVLMPHPAARARDPMRKWRKVLHVRTVA